MPDKTPPEPESTLDQLRKLQVPFDTDEIEKKPQPLTKSGDPEHCDECGRRHRLPAIHVDVVGHGRTRKRIMDADPAWSWRPESPHPDIPVIDYENGQPVGMWISLTILGVTHYGYGDVGLGVVSPMKQLIGDAIRNAAMNFGVGIDLWIKEPFIDDRPAGGPGGRTGGRGGYRRPDTRPNAPVRATGERARTRGDIWKWARTLDIRPEGVTNFTGVDHTTLSDADLEKAIEAMRDAR